MKKQLLPSLLSADFSNLQKEVELVTDNQIETIHLDVMDGHYVPNISFGPGTIASIRPHTKAFFDCHLMVEEPGQFFPAFQKAGCDLLTVQWEAVTHIHRALQQIHELGMKAGVAINPGTSEKVLEYILNDVDLILVMSVNPGFGGQKFIPQTMKKIERVRDRIVRTGRDIILEVDGGVKLNNVEDVIRAGADWVVAGSSVFSPGKTAENIRAFHEIITPFDSLASEDDDLKSEAQTEPKCEGGRS